MQRAGRRAGGSRCACLLGSGSHRKRGLVTSSPGDPMPWRSTGVPRRVGLSATTLTCAADGDACRCNVLARIARCFCVADACANLSRPRPREVWRVWRATVIDAIAAPVMCARPAPGWLAVRRVRGDAADESCTPSKQRRTEWAISFADRYFFGCGWQPCSLALLGRGGTGSMHGMPLAFLHLWHQLGPLRFKMHQNTLCLCHCGVDVLV